MEKLGGVFFKRNEYKIYYERINISVERHGSYKNYEQLLIDGDYLNCSRYIFVLVNEHKILNLNIAANAAFL
ncbi:hypothetical protein CN393_07815 [Bacillus cereus]|nr:hypothetical protein CN393_07815 [Bacillus cereus]